MPGMLLEARLQPGQTRAGEASWRSGYAEDCKSLHPGSIPGEASKANVLLSVTLLRRSLKAARDSGGA